MSIGVNVVKKINILFEFSNVNKLAVNSFGLWTVSRVGGRLTARLLLLDVLSVSSSHIPIHYVDKPQTKREAR